MENKILAYKIGFFLSSILIYFLAPVLIPFLYPGIIIYFYNITNYRNINFFENTGFSIALSLSYWIVGFWILKYLPISFYDFLFITFLGSIILVFFRNKKNINFSFFTKADLISLSLCFVIGLSFLPLFKHNLIPAGADMATHSYIARLIAEKNSFPTTYEPIAPSTDFGSSYMGISIIIAAVSKIAEINLGKSALITSVAVYIILGISIFLFLTTRFNKIVSFISSFSLIWIGKDIMQYYLWGGNPTVLALSLLFFALALFIKVINSRESLDTWSAFLIALLLAGSFLSHPTPLVILFYFIFGIALIELKNIKKNINRNIIVFVIKLGLFLLIMNIPFLSSFKIPSEETFTKISQIQRSNIGNTNWVGNINNFYYTIPLYMRERIGYSLFFVSSLGIFLSLFKPNREKIYFLGAIISEIILIINCQYWFLPLSPLLFPDRIISIGLIPFSFFVAVFFETGFNYFNKFFHINNKKFTEILTIFVAVNFLGVFFLNDLWQSTNWVYSHININTSVTEDDIQVFNWINKNTSENDIIANNYGDSGIWIPALAYRKITKYDATLYDLEKFNDNVKKTAATYLFVGSKPIYEKSIDYTYDKIKNNPLYKEVFNSGNAHLFRIINS